MAPHASHARERYTRQRGTGERRRRAQDGGGTDAAAAERAKIGRILGQSQQTATAAITVTARTFAALRSAGIPTR